MPLSIKYDYRFDPFTEADQAIDISSEEKAVPSNTPYYLSLEEVPRQDSPSVIVAYDVTDALTLSEVSGAPASGEFNVDYKYETGKVRFNSAQAGNTIRFDYKGTGHVIAGTFINILSDWIGKSYTVENDHDHDGVNSAVMNKTANKLRRFFKEVTGTSEQTNVSGTYPSTWADCNTTFSFYCPIDANNIYFSCMVASQNAEEGSYFRISVEGSATGATIDTIGGTTYTRLNVSIPVQAGWKDSVITITPQLANNYGVGRSKIHGGGDTSYIQAD